MVLERCTNAVASPFGVTGALGCVVMFASKIKGYELRMTLSTKLFYQLIEITKILFYRFVDNISSM